MHAKQKLGHLVFTLPYEQGLNQHLLCHIHDTNYTLLESAKALFKYIYRKYPYAVLPEIFMQITMLVEILLEYAICMLWSEFLTRGPGMICNYSRYGPRHSISGLHSTEGQTALQENEEGIKIVCISGSKTINPDSFCIVFYINKSKTTSIIGKNLNLNICFDSVGNNLQAFLEFTS